MKKFCITFLMSGIIILSAIGFGTGIFDSASAAADTEYLRILTPVVAEAETREAAIRLMNENLSGIERCADGVLRAHGFTYGAKAQVREEEFPTRVYGEYTLEAGVYQALILALGTGEGDNWWCVVYPPLCFAGQPGENVVYKSKIKEIIDEWKKNR